MQKILFIETSDIGAKYTASASRILGFEPLFVCQLNKIQGDTKKQLDEESALGHVISCNTESAEKIYRALIDGNIPIESISGVMTFLDSRLEVALELNKMLNCDLSLDSAIIKLKSKSEVQSLIPQWSPPSLIFDKKNISENQIQLFLVKFGKVILKPTKTAGAIGAQIFESPTLSELTSHIDNTHIPEFLYDDQWICQAYLEGPLFSIEGFVKESTVTILGVTSRSKIGFTESQFAFPVENNMSHQIQKAYALALQDLVSKANFKYGFFHVEFILCENQIYIIDANMGRLGGGPIGEMIPLSIGMSIEQFYAFVIEKSLMQNSDKVKLPRSKNILTLGACYGVEKEGFFDSLKIPIPFHLKHTLVLDTQQNIDQMGLNNWSWIGIVSGYENNFKNEIKKIEVTINSQPIDLCY